MSSLITVTAGEGENILPEMGELSEFHPDQLSNLVDIQEELDKLVAQEQDEEEAMSIMSAVDNVNVVDHEVTIGEEPDNDVEMTILPDMPDTDEQPDGISSLMEESLEIGETITIETPMANDSRTGGQLNNQHIVEEKHKMIPIRPAAPMMGQTSINVSQLKAIRPLPDALKGKRPGQPINLTSIKNNVLTRLVFQPNSQGNVASDSSIIFGDAGGQAIRIIGPNKTFLNSPKTITLAQAREMGLLSPGKVQHILPNQSKGVMKPGMVVDPNKTYAMVKSSPTKILPLPTSGQLHPIAPSPALNTLTTAPHKIFIRHPQTIKTGTFPNTILTSSAAAGQGQILQIPVSQDNLSSQIHQIQLPGKQVQYVRLVNTSAGNISVTPATNSSVGVGVESEPAPTHPSAPVPVALTTNVSLAEPGPAPVKMVHIASASTAPQNTKSFERILVSPGLSQLAARTTDAKPTTNNIVMVPAEYVKHYKPPSSSSPPSPPKPVTPIPTPTPASVPLLTKAKEVSITTKDSVNPLLTQKSKGSSEPPNGIRPRKPCNCTKSQCLKLYCDCFANGEFCFQCNCNSCFNNLDHEEERQRAIKACLERNPNAFRPKIGKGYIGDERRHNKGCNCKRSGCLKNYCECYEAKIPCSNNCKCVGCRNVEDSKECRDRSMTDISKMSQQAVVKNKLSSEIQESACRPHAFLTNQGTRQPFNLMTQEVVEATCQCLLAQVEGESQLTQHVERLILEEFGRCLVQIIDCATRTTVNNNNT